MQNIRKVFTFAAFSTDCYTLHAHAVRVSGSKNTRSYKVTNAPAKLENKTFVVKGEELVVKQSI